MCGVDPNLCLFNAIISSVFASVTLLFSIVQLRRSSYDETKGLQLSARSISPFLSFCFYGYFILQLTSNFILVLISYQFLVLSLSLCIHALGMFCFYHVEAVHSMYRRILPTSYIFLFRGSGIILIILSQIAQFVADFYGFQWPLLIPSAFGILKMTIDVVATWYSYIQILYFATDLTLDVKEKAKKNILIVSVEYKEH